MNDRRATEFRGSVVFVTGAASGIGRACAIRFARAGATVVVADLNDEDGQRTVDEITAHGGASMFAHVDVTQEAQIAGAVDLTVERFGRLDHAANCAGVNGGRDRGPLAQIDIGDFDRVVSINLRGTFMSMQYELRQMIRQSVGTIVNIASTAGLVAIPHTAAYVAAKHGVIGLTKSAAVEYGHLNIRVNAVCPGLVNTPMVADLTPDMRERVRQSQSLSRISEPTEIAAAVAWLSSGDASFVTGAALPVDGGFVAQ